MTSFCLSLIPSTATEQFELLAETALANGAAFAASEPMGNVVWTRVHLDPNTALATRLEYDPTSFGSLRVERYVERRLTNSGQFV